MPYTLKYGDRYRRGDDVQISRAWNVANSRPDDSGRVWFAGYLDESDVSLIRGALSDGLEHVAPNSHHDLMLAFESLINGGQGYKTMSCTEVLNVYENTLAQKQYIASTTNYYEQSITNRFGANITINRQAMGTNQSGAMDETLNTTVTGGCDSDSIYGFAVEAITSLYLLVVDFFEDEEVKSNGAERISRLWSAIPLLGQLAPVDEYLTAFDAFYEDGFEAFNATWSEAFEVDLICELFCFIKDNGCRTDANIVEEFLRTKVLTLPQTLSDWVSILQWFAGRDTSAGWYVYACLWWAIKSLQLANFFGFGSTFDDYRIQLLLGLSNPSDDWTILCPACLGWSVDYDFESSGTTNGWVIDSWGVVGAGGLQGQFSGTTSRLFIFASGDGSTPSTGQNWTWEIEYTLNGVAVTTDGAVPKEIKIAVDNDTGNVPNNTRQTVSLVGLTPTLRTTAGSTQFLSAGMNSMVIRNEIKKNNTNETYFITLHRLSISGDGERPAWLP